MAGLDPAIHDEKKNKKAGSDPGLFSIRHSGARQRVGAPRRPMTGSA
jgi:hypothetical protein